MKMILTKCEKYTNSFRMGDFSQKVYVDLLVNIHKDMTVVESRDTLDDSIKHIIFEAQLYGKKVFVDLHAVRHSKDENKYEVNVVLGYVIYTFTFEEVKYVNVDLYYEDFYNGYHKAKIEKGVNGEISKIQEELDELKDAEQQDIKVMQLAELSDLIGAIELYLEDKFPDISLDDLIKMKDATKRAFQTGRRS